MTAICGSDDDAVQRWAVSDPAGDALDVSALHREHFIHLTRLAVMLVGDRETAEDVVQDVFASQKAYPGPTHKPTTRAPAGLPPRPPERSPASTPATVRLT